MNLKKSLVFLVISLIAFTGCFNNTKNTAKQQNSLLEITKASKNLSRATQYLGTGLYIGDINSDNVFYYAEDYIGKNLAEVGIYLVSAHEKGEAAYYVINDEYVFNYLGITDFKGLEEGKLGTSTKAAKDLNEVKEAIGSVVLDVAQGKKQVDPRDGTAPLQITSVVATNGALTVTFDKAPIAPEAKEFKITEIINGTEKVLTITDASIALTNNAINVIVPVVNAAAADQTVSYKVSFLSINEISSNNIVIPRLLGTDATLTEIKLDGKLIEGFASDKLSYDVVLPVKTKNVLVEVTTKDANATAKVSDFILPNSAVITVTAEDKTTTKIYTVNFTVTKATDATLKDLAIDGVTITGFSAATTSYAIELPAKTTAAAVTAAANDTDATVTIAAFTVPGTVTVTVTAEDGITVLTYTITLTVKNIPVTGVTLDVTEKTLAIGAPLQLTATIAPADATNPKVTWSSSNEAVAKVDQTGLVTTVTNGEATITVTTEDGSKTAVCKITVLPNSPTIIGTTKLTKDNWFTGEATYALDVTDILGTASTVATLTFEGVETAVTVTNGKTAAATLVLNYGDTLPSSVKATAKDANGNTLATFLITLSTVVNTVTPFTTSDTGIITTFGITGKVKLTTDNWFTGQGTYYFTITNITGASKPVTTIEFGSADAVLTITDGISAAGSLKIGYVNDALPATMIITAKSGTETVGVKLITLPTTTAQGEIDIK